MSLTLRDKDVLDVLKNGTDALRHNLGPLGSGEEVGETGQDDHAGLLTHGGEGGLEDAQAPARDDLGRLHHGIGAAAGLGDILTNIGVANEGEHSGLRHRKPLWMPEIEKKKPKIRESGSRKSSREAGRTPDVEILI